MLGSNAPLNEIDRAPGRWNVTETGRELYQRALRAVHDFEEIETDFSCPKYANMTPGLTTLACITAKNLKLKSSLEKSNLK